MKHYAAGDTVTFRVSDDRLTPETPAYLTGVVRQAYHQHLSYPLSLYWVEVAGVSGEYLVFDDELLSSIEDDITLSPSMDERGEGRIEATE